MPVPTHADLAARLTPFDAILRVDDPSIRADNVGLVKRLAGGTIESGVDEKGLRFAYVRREARRMRVGASNYAIIPRSAIVAEEAAADE